MKPGIRSTEFWLTLAVTAALIIAIIADSVKEVLPEGFAAIAISVATAGYAISRGLAKINILLQTGKLPDEPPVRSDSSEPKIPTTPSSVDKVL